MRSHQLLTLTKIVTRQVAGRTRNILVGLVLCLSSVSATDLTIHLSQSSSLSRQTVTYQCDAKGPRIGIPTGPFSVEYINGGGNSLVVVPISGNSLVFSGVNSGSGSRYAAQQYTWWDAQGSVKLYSDSLTGKLQSTCRRVTGSFKQ